MSDIVLVHLSDLHFGDSDWPGQPGYDTLLADALPQAIRRVHQTLGVSPAVVKYLIVTGDLTNRGSDNNFQSAFAYLTTQYRVGGAVLLRGLGRTLGTDFWWVPGNHDHWAGKGRNWFGPLPTYSPAVGAIIPTPWFQPLVSLDSKLCLDLFGVDSSSGHAGDPEPREYLQSGTISPDEYRILEGDMKGGGLPGVPRVRALLLHHDLAPFVSFEETLVPLAKGSLRPRGLRSGDRESILDLGTRYDVSVLFTGHKHVTLSRRRAPTIMEHRAPSAFQGKAQSGKQGFLVHHLSLRPPRKVIWRTYTFLWSVAGKSGGRFVPADKPWIQRPVVAF